MEYLRSEKAMGKNKPSMRAGRPVNYTYLSTFLGHLTNSRAGPDRKRQAWDGQQGTNGVRAKNGPESV